MISKEKLIELLTKNYSKLFSVNPILVDEIIEEYNLSIRSDQRSFYIRYGNSVALLTSMFADCTFDRFKRYYTKQFPFDEITDEEMVPKGTCYFGHDFDDEFLCIENSTGSIYVYAFQEKQAEPYYENIESFLLYCFLKNHQIENYFDIVEINQNNFDYNQFKKSNEGFKIDGLKCKNCIYYFNEQTIIELNEKTQRYSIYKGAILEEIN
ncbi:MAG: hypothetical protein OC189_05205 [Acinetobacter sp.]|uniref:hypothetical protein n=1 Tax=Acinetobacter sp. TaxID=472 RepID=UPI00258B8BB5|nr:hypothetical protein [Acinetobacter sp.]MDK4791428.1 hypothetical protein [Acinetobacter sp.]